MNWDELERLFRGKTQLNFNQFWFVFNLHKPESVLFMILDFSLVWEG